MLQAILCSVLLGAVAVPQAKASDPIQYSTAAEYALHRIERLVILRRIDPSFQKSFAGMSVRINTPPGPAEATFAVHAYQVAGADGTKRSLDRGIL